MAHVLMASIPAPGHVNPHAEVIRRLVERGHRVSYVNDASWRTRVESLGAVLVEYPSVLADHTFAADTDAVAHLALFQDEYEAMLPTVTTLVDDDPPDLVLYDIAGVPARLVAAARGIPAVQLSPTYVAWQGYEDDMAEFLEGVRSDPRGVAYLDRQRGMLRDHGIDADPLDWIGRPERSVVVIAEEMQPHADDVDREVYTFVGPAVRRPDPSAWTSPDERPMIVVSLGSAFTNQPEFYRRCLEAFGDVEGHRLVLQIGSVDPAEITRGVPLPDGVEVHPWIPQREMLDAATVFVTHAGMGGSGEGLVTGTPMIAVPQAVDQFDNADALVALGVAVRLDTQDATVDALRAAYTTVTGPAVRARSLEAAASLARAGGVERAVEIAESALVVGQDP
jgi:MGT family glycosyltransferase